MLSLFQALYLFIISVSTVTMEPVYSTGLRVRKIPSIFLKKLISEKIQGFAQWQKPIKVGKLAKNSFFIWEKKKSLQVFFAFWTSDKNLEIYYMVSNLTLTLVQIL